MIKMGITESGDAALDLSWKRWVIDEGKPAILITKDPALLLNKVPDLFNYPVILHATITGYGGTLMEPNVKSPEYMIESMSKYLDNKDKIVIRVDPIIPSDSFLDKSLKVIESCASIGFTRYRISFMDYYYHIRDRLSMNYKYSEISKELYKVYSGSLHAPLDLRNSVLDKIRSILTTECSLEICGEPNMTNTGCISKYDFDILGLDYGDRFITNHYQRSTCKCLKCKTELLSNKHPCSHNCIYCYWKV